MWLLNAYIFAGDAATTVTADSGKQGRRRGVALTLTHWCRRRGCRWYKCTPKSFDLVKIRTKSLKIRTKSLKTFTNSLKIWANYLEKWAKMAPNMLSIWKKTRPKWHEELFLGGHFFGIFSSKFGRIRPKTCASQKICPLLNLCPDHSKEEQRGRRSLFHNSIIGKFWFIKIDLKQISYSFFYYFWSQYFCWRVASIIGNDIFVWHKFPLTSTFLWPLPPALPMFRRRRMLQTLS